MNRKIAAIFAADVAGFSTLVADDEEDALRRLKSYRAVIDDFIRQFGGTIFNTAGDSVMASFPSAVDAVRCSIDIQESLRTRNRAYPETRHMLFRIGINIGDVVERDGDLLGDGVNLAARLQGLADPGGVCISRSVHEQVVGKLSVGFEDLGEQSVKNIPTPVHAYGVAWRDDAPARSRGTKSRSSWIAAGIALGLVAAVSGYVILRGKAKVVATAPVAVPSVEPVKVAAGPVTPSPGPALLPQRRPFVAEAVPFLTDTEHKTLAERYVPAAGFKAIALNRTRHGYIVGAVDEVAAKALALQRCEARSKAAGLLTACELYAVGDDLVWPHARPPLPMRPWLTRDATIERPLSLEQIKRVRATVAERPALIERLLQEHLAYKKSKFIALHPHPRRGALDFYKASSQTEDEALRIVLELCAHKAKEPCIVAAVGDTMVVPVPLTMTVVGLFRAQSHPLISIPYREALERRFAAASNGWRAVAVGSSGQPEIAVDQTSEERATALALSACARREKDCKIVAIGPFAVEPNVSEAASPDVAKVAPPPAPVPVPPAQPTAVPPAPTPPAATEPEAPKAPVLVIPEASRKQGDDALPKRSNAAP